MLSGNVFSMKYQKYLISQVHKQRQQGHGKKYWNMHIKITFLTNLMQNVLLSDDLVMEDAGYGTAHNYIYAQEHQADVILRITPKNFCLYGTDGNKLPAFKVVMEKFCFKRFNKSSTCQRLLYR